MKESRISNAQKLESDLRREIAHSAGTRYLHRLHCVWLVSQTGSCQAVADWFGQQKRTIERWVRDYEQHGAAALLDRRKPGRPSRISEELAAALMEELAQNPAAHGYREHTWTGRVLKDHLKLRYEVDMSLRQCQRLLHRFGAVDREYAPLPVDARERLRKLDGAGD